MNVNNFVIDHVLRGIMVNKAGEYMWSINQITNPTLSVTMEDAAQAVDAMGSVIAEFDRGRNASFSAENSLFDLGLYAAQMGKEKQVASVGSTITAPAFETIEVKTGETEYTLAHTPNADVAVIYKLNGDGTLGEAYKAEAEAGENVFVYDEGKITVPTNVVAGDELFVMYEYEMESGVAVEATAVDFPKKGKFVLEVLGSDVCDQEKLIHAFVVFDNAKLSGSVDYSFTTDGTHPFEITAMQNYCDKAKKLFKIIIPDEE